MTQVVDIAHGVVVLVLHKIVGKLDFHTIAVLARHDNLERHFSVKVSKTLNN